MIYLYIILALFATAQANAEIALQTKNRQIIFGKIYDKNSNQILSNVNITNIQNPSIGTISNKDGNFSFDEKIELPVTLEFSHIGFENIQVLVDSSNASALRIYMNQTSIEMPQLNVTATRSVKKYKQLPSQVEIISRKMIDDAGVNNLNDLFFMMSGFNFERTMGPSPSIQFFGMDSKSVLVLFDGQPIIGKFNNRVSLDQILLHQIEKIEIIKGPSSSLHGSEAMAGVINIISKRITDKVKYDFGFKYQNSQSKFIQTKSLIKPNGSLYGSYSSKIGKTDLLISTHLENINDFDPLEIFEVDYISKANISFQINWKKSRENILSLKLNNHHQRETGSSKIISVNTDITRSSLILNNKIKNINQSLIINDYYRNYLKNRSSGTILQKNTAKERSFEYELIYNTKLMNGELTSGYEIRLIDYSSERIKNQKQEIINQSFFGQFNRPIFSGLGAFLGFRYDNYSEYEKVFNPSFGLVKNYEKLNLRFNWGKGFRSPTFLERYIDWNHAQYNYTVKGNESLKPEYSKGYTLGMDFAFSDRYEISLSGHHTKYINLIESINVGSGILSYVNLENAINYSFELNQSWKPTKKTNIDFSFQTSKRYNSNSTILPNNNPVTFTISLNHEYKDLRFIFLSKWFAKFKLYEISSENEQYFFTDNYMNSRTLSSFAVQKDIYKNFKMKFGLSNIENHIDERYGPYVGRGLSIELQSSF